MESQKITLEEVFENVKKYYTTVPDDQKVHTKISLEEYKQQYDKWEKQYNDKFVFVEPELELEFLRLAYLTLNERLGVSEPVDEDIVVLSQLLCTVYLLGIGVENWKIKE